MTTIHPSPEALEGFVLGQLSPLEMREVARHLLLGCPACQDVTAGLWEPTDVFEDPQVFATVELADEDDRDAYDDVLDKVFEKVVATEARLVDQRAVGRKLFEELLQVPSERRHLVIGNSQRFRNRMLCERLVDESYEAGFSDPRRAVELAQLGVQVADRLEVDEWGGEGALAGLRARAWAQLGNAFRINSDLASSERAFQTTESLLAESRVPLIEKARVLSQLASCRRTQHRFGEALQIFDRVAAIYKKLGQWNLLGRTFLQKALVCSWAGDGEGEMSLLRRALDLIDPQADPRVFLAARHNLIHALYERGSVREAFALLYHSRPLYLKAGDRMNLLKLRWLEGLVALGLQRIDQAEAAFREVREAFIDLDLGYDAALASLDLASVYVLQGRTGDVRRVAEETLAVFQAHHTHRDSLAALLVFHSAARVDQVGIDLIKEVSSFLKRARNNPDLSFYQSS
jgi:tetratricopeptide (TPR) repeat protein